MGNEGTVASHGDASADIEANRPVGPRTKKVVLTAAVTLFLIAVFFVLRALLSNHIEIRGTISPRDLAAITGNHNAYCGVAWPGLKWFPEPIRNFVIARLNPIEIVSVPKDGVAIVVYRGFDNLYYDKKGKHRWGTAYYTLFKDESGWHQVISSPTSPTGQTPAVSRPRASGSKP
jgi:hypothetical protein